MNESEIEAGLKRVQSGDLGYLCDPPKSGGAPPKAGFGSVG